MKLKTPFALLDCATGSLARYVRGSKVAGLPGTVICTDRVRLEPWDRVAEFGVDREALDSFRLYGAQGVASDPEPVAA